MSEQPTDFVALPGDQELDETDVNFRAYLASLPDEHLAEYDPIWTNEEVIAWNGNFRSDGALMLVCCTREVEVDEFREVLEDYLRHRRLGKFA